LRRKRIKKTSLCGLKGVLNLFGRIVKFIEDGRSYCGMVELHLGGSSQIRIWVFNKDYGQRRVIKEIEEVQIIGESLAW